MFAGGVKPPSAGPRKPHEPKAEHATAGARLFTSMNCDGCHGGGATGWVGPSLVDGRWRYGGTDEEVFHSIFYGRPKGMPAYGGVLGTEGVWMIVSYLKSQPVPSVVPTTSYENTDGRAGAAPAGGAASAPAACPPKPRRRWEPRPLSSRGARRGAPWRGRHACEVRLHGVSHSRHEGDRAVVRGSHGEVSRAERRAAEADGEGEEWRLGGMGADTNAAESEPARQGSSHDHRMDSRLKGKAGA